MNTNLSLALDCSYEIIAKIYRLIEIETSAENRKILKNKVDKFVDYRELIRSGDCSAIDTVLKEYELYKEVPGGII